MIADLQKNKSPATTQLGKHYIKKRSKQNSQHLDRRNAKGKIATNCVCIFFSTKSLIKFENVNQ